MTKEILNNLPEVILMTIEDFKKRYHDDRFKTDIERAEIRGYLKGLRQTGVLKSDNEYRLMFSYMTV